MKTLKRLLLGAAIGVVLGCTTSIVERLDQQQYVDVVVRNENWALMRLYVAPNQINPRHFGEVETGQTRTFHLRLDPTTTYGFYASALAGQTYSLGSVTVVRGTTVAINIENQITLSSVFLR